MIIYNVTTKVEAAIAPEWLRWMQQQHIPAMMATGCFTDFKMVRLLEVDDSEGPTYAVQYSTATRADYDRYLMEFSDVLQKNMYAAWGNGFISFCSLMELMH